MSTQNLTKLFRRKTDMGVNYRSKKDLGVGERFVSICEYLFPDCSRQKIAVELGVEHESRVRLYEGGSLIEPAVLARLKSLGASVDWLLFGEGEMLAQPKKSPPKAGTKEAADMAELSLMAVEVQEELNDIHRRALQGDLTAEDFKAILLAVTDSVNTVARSKKRTAKKSTA